MIPAKITSNIIFPAFHLLKGDGLWFKIKEYEKSQWFSYDRLKEIQHQKLNALLKHSFENVDYYYKLIDKYGIDINKSGCYNNFLQIPFLTKKKINENREQLIANTVKKRDLISNSTSGSTGENLFFFQDKAAMLPRQAMVWRNQKWTNTLYTDRQVYLWGAAFDIKKNNSIRGKIHTWFNQSISLSSYELSDRSMAEYIKILKSHKPKLLISYPGPLTTFAEYLIKNRKTISGIKAIITSAETLYPWQKSTIAEAFKCNIYDRYGCREFGTIAHECEKHEGYHINMERFFLEVIGEDGMPVKSGKSGEIVITDLDNYCFPFIRYKIGDIAVCSDSICSCGRGLPLLEKIEGRAFDMIIGPNGNKVAGTFWTLALRSVSGVKNFQIEQTDVNNIKIRLIQNHSYSDKSEKKIFSIIKKKLGSEINIEFIYVDNIDLTKSGKRRFVISSL